MQVLGLFQVGTISSVCLSNQGWGRCAELAGFVHNRCFYSYRSNYGGSIDEVSGIPVS